MLLSENSTTLNQAFVITHYFMEIFWVEWLKNNYLEAQIIFATAKPKYEFLCLYLSNTWLALTSKDPTEDLRNCYIIFISYVATIYFYPAVSLKTADRCNLKTVFWKTAEINMSTDLPFDFVVSAILLFTECTVQKEWYSYSSKDMFSLWRVCRCLLDCDLQVFSEDWISHVYKSSLHE